MENQGLLIEADAGPGILHSLTGVIAGHNGDIGNVSILENSAAGSRVYFEVTTPGWDAMLEDLRGLPVVRSVNLVKSMQEIYGKRIIIMGGGAPTTQVAIPNMKTKPIRHNIRGEHISVDTIPLVGEQALAEAVRAVARLPRARALVMAGSLMGGDIEAAVREVRATGLLVISLNMAGSVPDAADLVVSDPIQAGVMAVMAVADTAKFTVGRLNRRVF